MSMRITVGAGRYESKYGILLAEQNETVRAYSRLNTHPWRNARTQKGVGLVPVTSKGDSSSPNIEGRENVQQSLGSLYIKGEL